MSTVPLQGIVKRARAKLQIIRGFYLNEPQKLSTHAPLESGEQAASGQFLVLDKASDTFKIATKALFTANNGFAHALLADWNNRDVIAAGVANGLSMTDSFEFQTAYYAPDAYQLNDELTISDTVPGALAKAVAGDFVIARVSRKGGEADGSVNLKGVHSGVEDAGLKVLTVETVPRTIKA